MIYQSNRELPESVKDNVPAHAQDIYREAYNSAFEEYDDPEERRGGADQEETAHKVAWSAVKKEYGKNEEGEWVKKD